MGFVTLACLVLLSAISTAIAVEPVDVSKFSVDGETTYCKIAPAIPPPSTYTGLNTTSVGKCPVIIKLSIAAVSFTMTSSIFNVSWTASANPNRSAADFPARVENGKIRGLLASVYACKAGTACERDSIVVPATILRLVDTQFDLQNREGVPLASFLLEIPSKGDYVIAGEVVTETGVRTDQGVPKVVGSIAFHRVRAASEGFTLPGTVRPPVAEFAIPSANSPEVLTPSQVEMPVAADFEDGTNSTKTNVTSDSTSRTIHPVIALVIIVAAGLVVAVLIMTYWRKKDQSAYTESTDARQVRVTRPRVESPVPAFRDRPPVQMMAVPNVESIGQSAPSVNSFLGKEKTSSLNDSYQRKSEGWSISSLNESMMQSKISFGDSSESASGGKKPRLSEEPNGSRTSSEDLESFSS